MLLLLGLITFPVILAAVAALFVLYKVGNK